MIICPRCNYENLVGALFCDNCGELLIKKGNRKETRPITAGEQAAIASPVSRGTGSFGEDVTLILDLGGAERRTLTIPDGGEILIGRVDRMTARMPDVNLAQLGGWECGVSRSHAVIRRTGDQLHLVDLGSTNGSFLNGQRIVAGDPQLLHDGDNIRLGLFDMRVYFSTKEI